MKYTVKIESLPAIEYLVIKGCGRIYDNLSSNDAEAWDKIKSRIDDGTVERLQKAAGSENIYMLFCNTCIRNEADKCYDCGYDIACENKSGIKAGNGFETVRLNPCDYAVFDCEFESEIEMRNAHGKPDSLFWNEWLKENPYTCAIDDPQNWTGNGFSAIEQYTPFDPDANIFKAVFWYPILRKE